MKTPDEIKKGLECCLASCEDCGACPYNGEDCRSKERNRDALALIHQLESKVPKWISAKEPPKEWKDDDGTLKNFLVYTPEYGVDIGNYMKTAKTWVCMGIPCKVTHWMPLPEPLVEV